MIPKPYYLFCIHVQAHLQIYTYVFMCTYIFIYIYISIHDTPPEHIMFSCLVLHYIWCVCIYTCIPVRCLLAKWLQSSAGSLRCWRWPRQRIIEKCWAACPSTVEELVPFVVFKFLQVTAASLCKILGTWTPNVPKKQWGKTSTKSPDAC